MTMIDPQQNLDLLGGKLADGAAMLEALNSGAMPTSNFIEGDTPRELEGLHRTFELFGQMSQQLSQSYVMLEDRVKHLSSQLEKQTAERIKELAEKEQLAERLTGLLDLLPGGVVVINEDGLLEQCNPAARELLTIYPGELIGSRWVDIIRSCFRPKHDDGHEVSTADGRRLSISTRSLDNQPGQIVLLTDQTETRRLQAELSRSERLSAMGKMVASLAHQIRTPLSAAMLFGGHLGVPHIEDEKRLDIADRLMSRLMHLEQQVRDMLIFAKGELKTAELVKVKEFCLSLQEAVSANRWPENVYIDLRNECPEEQFYCNTEALVGAVLNLVENAVQATSHQVTIQISLNQSEDQKFFVCSVKDDGPGIDDKTLSKVMEPFYTTKSQGTGLGLAVVKAVVTAHGGDFSLVSESGEGTRAEMTIPFARITPAEIEGAY
ncbi:sensor histidine kinase [Litoribacillus peritrichatus]|uniref:histidine kinase n=1 Tax=Litoribacillus peritrichatus TaxID=718191 RepID=A0ABP7M4W2_9GAMM